jgi:hypothetical protein
MKRPSASRLLGDARQKIVMVSGQRFFQDRLSLAILIPTVALNVITLLVMVTRLHPTGFDVPVHYSSLSGFDALGPWYQIYNIGVFGLVVTVANTLIAQMSFGRSRITSFFLLTGSFVVALFSLIIGTAFAVVV